MIESKKSNRNRDLEVIQDLKKKKFFNNSKPLAVSLENGEKSQNWGNKSTEASL